MDLLSRSDTGKAALSQRKSAIATLTREIERCRICRDAPTAKKPLPHEPRPVLRLSATARIAICGQAPGTRVHASGIPFTDPSGDRLRDWMGVTPAEFYDTTRIAIVPMGFCFPGLDAKGGDLPPRQECAQAWHTRIFALHDQFELILLVGHYAMRWHLGRDCPATLTETVRGWSRLFGRCDGPRYLPLPHPSWRNTGWLKANPWFGAEVLAVLRAEVRRLIE